MCWMKPKLVEFSLCDREGHEFLFCSKECQDVFGKTHICQLCRASAPFYQDLDTIDGAAYCHDKCFPFDF